MKAAFLERDGTICRDYPDEEWSGISAPELLPGTVEGMVEPRRMGFALIVLANQYTIGEGIITLEQYRAFDRKLRAAQKERGAELLDVFFCPHRRDEGCDCCKPRTGLVRQALEKYPEIDLGGSFFAGDSTADAELARRCGLRFFRIGGPGARDLAEVARRVMEEQKALGGGMG